MRLPQTLRRLESYTKKLVEKKTKKKEADRYKLWSFEMWLEAMTLKQCFPDVPGPVIDEDVESRSYRIDSEEGLIRYGINRGWRYVDWLAELESL